MTTKDKDASAAVTTMRAAAQAEMERVKSAHAAALQTLTSELTAARREREERTESLTSLTRDKEQLEGEMTRLQDSLAEKETQYAAAHCGV
jgi:predicted  nucleic acid-binding Zn-ribbon protein